MAGDITIITDITTTTSALETSAWYLLAVMEGDDHHLGASAFTTANVLPTKKGNVSIKGSFYSNNHGKVY